MTMNDDDLGFVLCLVLAALLTLLYALPHH